MKHYDEPYFRRWYGARGSVPPAELKRRARLALAAAEYLLERPVRSVLDVGCGEGRWRAPLLRIRPGLAYVGVDPSEFVVRRHGRRRGIRLGSLGGLGELGLRRRFDLVVCSDVIHYVQAADLRRGLAAMHALAGGLVYVDAFTSEDAFEGDRDAWQPRSARAYRRAFGAAGFVACGLNCWVGSEQADRLSALERGG